MERVNELEYAANRRIRGVPMTFSPNFEQSKTDIKLKILKMTQSDKIYDREPANA